VACGILDKTLLNGAAGPHRLPMEFIDPFSGEGNGVFFAGVKYFSVNGAMGRQGWRFGRVIGWPVTHFSDDSTDRCAAAVGFRR
jgi:hypothetical protein